MNLRTLLPVVILIFLAGCVQQTSTAITPSGLIVTQFSPEVSEVFESEELVFTAIVQNVGDSVAREVKATIFGIDSTQWSIDNAQQNLPDLEPQEEYEIIWTATSPVISVPEFTFTPVVRVEYYYRTAGTATVRIVSDSYYDSLPVDQRTTLQTGIMSTQVSKGPITVSFSTTKKLFKYSTSTTSFPIKITIQNIGGGIPFWGTDEKIVRVKITSGSGSIDCGDEAYATGKTVQLIRGERRTIICNVSPPSDFVNLIDVGINVNVDYKYYIDASTTVKVVKGETQIVPQTA